MATRYLKKKFILNLKIITYFASGVQNFEMAPRFLEKVYTHPENHYIFCFWGLEF